MPLMADLSKRDMNVNIYLLTFTLLLLNLPQVSSNFDKYFCDEIVQSNLELVNGALFFPRAFSALAERSEYGKIEEGLLRYSRSFIQFSEHSGQMAVETESRLASASWFVDSKLNVCLVHHETKGPCVKTTDPCKAIGRLTKNLILQDGKVSLKSARETLGLNPSRLKKAVKVGTGQTRGIDSLFYVTCEDVGNGSATVISQWHFLDNTKYKVMDDKPVLLMARHQREEKDYEPAKIIQVDYGDFKQVRDDNFLPNLEHVNSKCISDNMKDVNKTIPLPPASFSYTKETRVGQAGVSIESVRDVEILHYNYDAKWFHLETFLTYTDSDAETVTKVTEDFNTNVRYETINNGKWCKTFPIQTMSSVGDTKLGLSNKIVTPSEYWNINPERAVYLGEADIRGVPCDAWRVGLSDRDETKMHTLFLATKKWLKRRRLSIDSFVPLEYIEQTGSDVKHYSYFGFKNMFCDFVPDISPCFNSNHSVGVRFILDTNFYENIQNYAIRFECSLRNAVQELTGLDSPLQVANIRTRPSPANPHETRVSFKILGKAGLSISFPRPKSTKRDTGSAIETVEKLKSNIREGKFEFKYTGNATEVSVKALPDSFYLLKEGVCEDHQDYSEQTSKPGYSSGSVAGICILVFLVALVIGNCAIYVYMRCSGKKLKELDPNRPSSSASVTRSIFNMVSVKTEEANSWSWA